MKPLVIGLDFGTESARALLLDLDSGLELAVAVEPYPHGVLTHRLPSGQPLPELWALHHPADYLQVSQVLLQKMRFEAYKSDGEIVGLGIDTTASSPLPTDALGTPLALKEGFEHQPHAYLKLWKHHAAEPYAQAINLAHPGFLQMYGGTTSAEWSLAKAWQVLEEAPEVWEATARWIEVGDWLVWQFTGQEVRSSCQAGYKAHWQPTGYPEAAQLRALRPGLESWLDKLAWPHPVGQKAGGLSQAWAQHTGLPAGIPVATATIDAHAAVPGVGVQESGVLVAILGTSSCHLTLSRAATPVPGIAGIVADGILPGLYGYECGQPASGDMLAWWVRTLAWAGQVPENQIFEQLNLELAQRTARPSGLLALDWWNGCRTPLMNASLKGALSGLDLATDPPQIYQALIEATALGTRWVKETLERAVGSLPRVVVTGGLSKIPAIVQILANVLGCEVEASSTSHASARGAALYAAMAAGFPLPPAPPAHSFIPNSMAYLDLYPSYRSLAEYFGFVQTKEVRN
ncbi:ribulokinase [Meiothermus taiwanensis]|jgi:L-ribulokinase|uniref:Ribulokinase n=1 Tax=Meiothermus taiwanensis TaxID=172827 RepID=A0A399E5Y4_9DEIN|nr:ribulokinase [Meiothermus taiwanensis]KIQ54131.1 carbohydrate kinase [Meiothermus taiwanensis]KZK15786.1 carbohydrate kinase [Meiothermus taiwanensis]RIH77691.1 Ribulokinase [Meiothermus taiwanensis]